jgi:single-strand DNA-binding protein
MSFSNVTLHGNIVRDIETRNVGTASVAGFSVAVNRKWKDKDGETREEVSYIDCEAWGKTGEVIAQYMSKGSPIIVVGRLKQDSWESKEGEKRTKLKVVVEQFDFVGGKDRDASPAPTKSRAPAPRGKHAPAGDDDIPF